MWRRPSPRVGGGEVIAAGEVRLEPEMRRESHEAGFLALLNASFDTISRRRSLQSEGGRS